MKYIQAVFLLILVAFHESIFSGATDILGVTINLPAMLVVAVALHHAESDAIWFALAVGIVAGAVMPATMGWQALIFVILAIGAYHARERLNLDSPLARLSLIIGGVLAHNIVNIFIIQPEDLVYQIWRFALTGTLYSALVASAFYVFRQSTTSGRRTRMM
jgi:rod shape-determining protein MreD